MKTTRNLLTVVMMMAAIGLMAGSAGAAIIVDPGKIQSGSATGTLVAIDVPFVTSFPTAGGPDWSGLATADPADNGFTTRSYGIREQFGTSTWEPDGTPISEARDFGTFPTGNPNVSYNFNLADSGIDIPDGATVNAVYATWTRRGGGDGATYTYTEGADSGSLAQTHTVNPTGDLVLSWTDDVSTTRNGNFDRLFTGPITVAGGDGFELTATDNLGNAAHIDAVVLDVTLPGGGPKPPEATILKPVSVSTSITGDAGSSHLYLLDDNPSFAAAGLQRPVGTGVTLNTGDPLSDALATVAERSAGGHAESWTRPIGSGLPEFVFDLTGGGDTPVESIILWQYGNNGGGAGRIGNATKDFRVILHTEAEGDTFDFSTETADMDDIMQAFLDATVESNVAQIFDFASVQNARYAAFRIDDNYGGEPGIIAGGDRYGLGEVRFVAPPAAAGDIPEPATMALLGLAVCGLGGYVRRRRNV